MKLTNPDKVLYPATGTTKAEVFDYYVNIAEVMIPHIAGRAVTRKRWPNGVDEPSFFEKQLAWSAPDWLDRGASRTGPGTTTYPIIDTVEGLAWIAQQAALEVHVPQWRFVDGKPGPATRIVFDLDPGEGVTLPQLCEVAHEVRDLISDIGLTTYPLTSGSKGLHLYVPLDEPISSRGASVLAQARRPATRKDDAEAGHRDDDQEPARRQGASSTGARTTRPRRRSRRIRCADANIRPSPRRAPGTRSRTRTAAPALRRGARAGRARRAICSAALDEAVPVPDELTTYRSMRDAAKTPEPVPNEAAKPATTTASSSRSTTPAGCTTTSGWNATACWCRGRCRRTCRHPVGQPPGRAHRGPSAGVRRPSRASIPKGEYGGGEMIIWDTGTYETEKFSDNPPDGPAKGGEVIVTLHGNKIDGRYALIQTDGKNWLAHRMKEQKQPTAGDLAPMLSTRWFGREAEGERSGRSRASGTATGCWSTPTTAGSPCGRAAAATSPASIPQLESLAADLADHHVILDGEAVALDEHGRAELRRDAEPGPFHPRRVLGVRHSATRRPIAVARQVLRPQAAARGAGRGRRADRPGPVARRRTRGARATRASSGGRVWSPRSATPPTSRDDGRRRGSRTSSGTPRKS